MIGKVKINWPVVNLGIGTSALELELELDSNGYYKCLISSFIRPMDPKFSRVVIYDEKTPPTKSHDTLIS